MQLLRARVAGRDITPELQCSWMVRQLYNLVETSLIWRMLKLNQCVARDDAV